MTENKARFDSSVCSLDVTGSRQTLRDQAEKSAAGILARMQDDPKALSAEEAKNLIHELRVHQIELEMQNEELRRAQTELEALRSRYFDLYDLASVGYLTLSESGLILEANFKAAVLAGVDRTALIMQPLTRFILSEDQDIWYRHCNKIIKTGEPQTCELRMQKKGNSFFWVRLESNAVRDGDGNLVNRVVLSDITERRQAVEALRLSQAHLQNLVQTIPDLIWLKNPDGVYLDCNVMFERFFGALKKDIIGKTDYDFVDRELADFFREHDRKAMAVGMPCRNEEWLIFADDGHRALYETIKTPMSDARGNLIGVLGIARDITDLRRAEMSLKESNEMLSLFMKHSPIFAFIKETTPTENRVVMASENYISLVGIPGSEMVGKTMAELFPSEFAAKITADDWEVVSGGKAIHVDEDFNGRNYTSIKFPISLGDKTLLAGYTIDVTERKRAETMLLKSEQDLREKNEELMRFTYSVSHDLKSPLVTIKTFLGYLEQDIARTDAERIEKDVTYIRVAAEKMGNLLDELLRLSRIGRVVSSPEAFPLQSIVQEALDLVAGQIALRGVKIQVTTAPVIVTGDRLRLVEVFQNLLDNAVKFMGDQPAPVVEIGVTTEGGDTVYYVRDNGIGIDPQNLHNVFGLFEKLNPESAGSGLGLALVKRIVEVHGGRIWAVSEGKGRGSTFCFTLPKSGS